MTGTTKSLAAPTIQSLRELMARQLPELRWAVPGLLPEGLAILAAPPKSGKSWLTHQISLAVASGGIALSFFDVEVPGEVLLLALEDSERRLQDRTAFFLGDQAPPEGFDYSVTWPRLDEAAIDHVTAWLDAHSGARLVVIDTLGKIRGPRPRNADSYFDDYQAGAQLKQLADRFHVAILVVHHSRKLQSGDWLADVSGTFGLTGAADTIIAMIRVRGQPNANLHVTGRDLADAEYALEFDQRVGWVAVGDADTHRMGAERAEVVKMLTDAGTPMTPKQASELLGKGLSATKKLLWMMSKDGQLNTDNGRYWPVKVSNQGNHGNSGNHGNRSNQPEQTQLLK